MSLLNRNTSTPNPFEAAEDEAVVATAVETVAAAPAPAPVAAPAPATAVATVAPQSKALAAVRKMADCAVLESLRDAVTVDWNTLDRLKVSQGNFKNDQAVSLGDELHIQLVSWQKQWQASPGGKNDDATKKLVRYSKDGQYIQNSTDDIRAYVNQLKAAGHKDAKLSERVVLVFMLLGGGAKAIPHAGNLFQIDLPPTSKGKFDAFRLRQAMNLAANAITEDQATHLKLTITGAKNGDNEYSLVLFDYGPVPG